MRNKIIINTFLLTIMALATVALVGLIIWNKPHKNIKDAVAVETNAIALYQALSRDSSKMKMAYLNKVVAVSGKVKQIQKNQEGTQVILLETNIPGASVNCTMEENDDAIKPGDTIEIKGMCIGYINGDAEIGLAGRCFFNEVLQILLTYANEKKSPVIYCFFLRFKERKQPGLLH